MKKKEKIIVKCKICNKEFFAQPSRKNVKYCSRECYHKARIVKVECICQYCGKKFKTFLAETKRRNVKYCSQECFNKGRIKGKTKKCPICNKEFYRSSSYIKRGIDKYCSRECYGISERGISNHNWMGGVSFNPYPYEFTTKLKKQMKEKDNYTCQKCGGKEDLAIHHINYNKKDNRPENLITLCRSCNGKVNFHREFWKGFFMGKIYERGRQMGFWR